MPPYLLREISLADSAPFGTAFVETFIFEPTLAEQPLGRLCIIGQVYSTRKRKDNARLLTEIVHVLKEEYYRKSSRDPFRSFTYALKHAGSALKERGAEFKPHALKINLAVCAFFGKRFLFARLEDTALFLMRDGTLHMLDAPTPSLPQNVQASFSAISEGSLKPEDSLVIATKEIFRIDRELLAQLLAEDALESFIEENAHEFSRIGIITISPHIHDYASTAAKPQPFRAKPFAAFKKLILPEGSMRWKRVGIFIAVGLLALGGTLSALLLHWSEQNREEHIRVLARDIEDTEAHVVSLIELANQQEAEEALIEWRMLLDDFGNLAGTDSTLYKELESRYENLSRQIRKVEPVITQTVIDLRDNSVSFTPHSMRGTDDTLILLSDSALYRYDIQQRLGSFSALPPAVPFGESESASLIDASPVENSSDLFLLFRDVLVRYGNDVEFIANVNEPAVRLLVFDDTFYIVGPSAIWVAQEGGLRNWSPDFSPQNVHGAAADEFIYVLDDKKLYKLLNGTKRSEFDVEPGTTSLFTAAYLDHIYLLNSAEGYVAVLDKNGTVARRLAHDNLASASDIFVDQNEKTLFFLSGQRVFSFRL